MGLYKDCCYCCVKFSLISVNSLDPTQSDIFFQTPRIAQHGRVSYVYTSVVESLKFYTLFFMLVLLIVHACLTTLYLDHRLEDQS